MLGTLQFSSTCSSGTKKWWALSMRNELHLVLCSMAILYAIQGLKLMPLSITYDHMHALTKCYSISGK